ASVALPDRRVTRRRADELFDQRQAVRGVVGGTDAVFVRVTGVRGFTMKRAKKIFNHGGHEGHEGGRLTSPASPGCDGETDRQTRTRLEFLLRVFVSGDLFLHQAAEGGRQPPFMSSIPSMV